MSSSAREEFSSWSFWVLCLQYLQYKATDWGQKFTQALKGPYFLEKQSKLTCNHTGNQQQSITLNHRSPTYITGSVTHSRCPGANILNNSVGVSTILHTLEGPVVIYSSFPYAYLMSSIWTVSQKSGWMNENNSFTAKAFMSSLTSVRFSLPLSLWLLLEPPWPLCL